MGHVTEPMDQNKLGYTLDVRVSVHR